MKARRLAALLVLIVLLLAGCKASPESDYMAPVRAYCQAMQDNDFARLRAAMPAAVLSSSGLDAGELDEPLSPYLGGGAKDLTITADALRTKNFSPKECAELQRYLSEEYDCVLSIDAANLLKLHLKMDGEMSGELTVYAVVYRANSTWYVEFSPEAIAIKK